MERNRPLKQRLAGAGYSLAEVARRVELSRAAVSRIVNGKYELGSPLSLKSRRDVVGCIAALLEVEVSEIDALVPQDAPSHGGALDRRTIAARRANQDRREEGDDDRRLEDERRRKPRALAS